MPLHRRRAVSAFLPPMLALALVAGLATGCARQETRPDTAGTVTTTTTTDGMSSQPGRPGEVTTTTTTTGAGAGGMGAGGPGTGTGPNGDMNASAPGEGANVIYFGYDADSLDGEAQAKADGYGSYMMQPANAGLAVRVEGNTDERGSAEYNVALGERRAVAVSRALMAQGVAKSRLRVVTYGATRPAVPGHDESAWAKNRRVEIHPNR